MTNVDHIVAVATRVLGWITEVSIFFFTEFRVSLVFLGNRSEFIPCLGYILYQFSPCGRLEIVFWTLRFTVDLEGVLDFGQGVIIDRVTTFWNDCIISSAEATIPGPKLNNSDGAVLHTVGGVFNGFTATDVYIWETLSVSQAALVVLHIQL